MSADRSRQQVYAEDKLAGLVFWTEGKPCVFRADCGYDFNHPLDPANESYVAIDPETNLVLGIQSPDRFVGDVPPRLYRVFLLRPLLPPFNITMADTEHLTVDEMKAMIRDTFEMMQRRGLL